MTEPDLCTTNTLKPIFREMFKRMLDGNNAFTDPLKTIEKDGFDCTKLSTIRASGKSYYTGDMPVVFKQTMHGPHAHVVLILTSYVKSGLSLGYYRENQYRLDVELCDRHLTEASKLLYSNKFSFGVFSTRYVHRYYNPQVSFHDFIINELYESAANNPEVAVDWKRYVERIRTLHNTTLQYI